MAFRRRAGWGVLALIALSGCSAASLATQSKPICSWTVSPPPDATHRCSVVFTTLRTLARADVSGDNATVRRIVVTPVVARQIIAYGRRMRALGASNVHVVPSLTLDITADGLVGARTSLVGSIRGGRLREPFTLYLRLRGDSARVVAHDPGYAW